MIEQSTLIFGVVLSLMLMALVVKGWMAARNLQESAPLAGEIETAQACPEVFVSRVFSRDDWQYVHGLKSTGIARLSQRERKKVALVWVRQTSLTIRKAMSEHARAARQSQNLESSTEIAIFLRFLILMVLCGILSVAIQTVGPLFLAGLARFAQRLSQRVVKVHESFESGTLVKAAGKPA